jgi:hypothetical protein
MASIDDLFAVPPTEFTQARNALVKDLRAKGKTDEAKRAAALRRPTAALWVANQLARTSPDDVKALIDSAERMRRAHAHGGGDELRDAMREQREATQAITRAAEQAAREIGAHANLDLLRRVQETAQAAAASAPDALRSGTLEEELAPVGFEALAGTHVAAPKPARAHAATTTHKSKGDGEDRAAQKKERARLERELHAAEREAQRLRKAADAAEEKAKRAQEEADEARKAAVEARRSAREATEAALSLRKDL